MFNSEFVSGLLGAVIGAGATLAATRYQIREDKKERELEKAIEAYTAYSMFRLYAYKLFVNLSILRHLREIEEEYKEGNKYTFEHVEYGNLSYYDTVSYFVTKIKEERIDNETLDKIYSFINNSLLEERLLLIEIISYYNEFYDNDLKESSLVYGLNHYVDSFVENSLIASTLYKSVMVKLEEIENKYINQIKKRA